MNFQKIKRSLTLALTIAIIIILFNIFTTAPQNTPQSSDKIKFTSLTEIEKQVDLVQQSGYGYSLFCWEYTSIPLRKIISFLKQLM